MLFFGSSSRAKIEHLFDQQQKTLRRHALQAMISLLPGPSFDAVPISTVRITTSNPILSVAFKAPIDRPHRVAANEVVSVAGKLGIDASSSMLSRIVLPWLCDIVRCKTSVFSIGML